MIERKRLKDVKAKEAQLANAEKVIRRTRNRAAGDAKNLVHLAGKPHLRGHIIERGPEQSLVRWTNGNECYVVNEWVRPVNLSKPE